MNLALIKTHVSNFVGDPSQTRFASQYLNAINTANEQFALETKSLWKDKSWSHAANDEDEDLPTDFMWEDWVLYDGVELRPISRHELQRLYGSDWSTIGASKPTHFIIDPEEAVKEIRLFPIPSTAATLSMRYFPKPADLSSDSDIPLNSSLLMVQFHLAIAAYAAWLLLAYEELTPAIQTKRNELLKIYNDGATKAVDTFKNTASAPLKIKGTRIWR